MKEWLATADFAPNPVSAALDLVGVDKHFLLRALGGDINRVAIAASESLRNIVPIESMPKSLGWPYVKLYYGALFYAHCLLRIWGRSPSYLMTSDLQRVGRSITAYGVERPFPLQTGQFLLLPLPSANTLRIVPDKKGGGSHEAIWRELHYMLTELQSKVDVMPYLSSDKAKILQQIAGAIDLLTNRGANVSWLSQMRNYINYRQGEGLWYPYEGRNKSLDFATAVAAYLDGDVDFDAFFKGSASGLERFRAGCTFVIAMARAVLNDLSAVAGHNGFLRHGQFKFESTLP